MVVLDLNGAVTAAAEEALKSGYHAACAAGASIILLNFTLVDHLDSSGIAAVIGLLGEARERGQHLLVTGLTPHYRKIFDLMGLPQYAPVFETEEAARHWAQTHS